VFPAFCLLPCFAVAEHQSTKAAQAMAFCLLSCQGTEAVVGLEMAACVHRILRMQWCLEGCLARSLLTDLGFSTVAGCVHCSWCLWWRGWGSKVAGSAQSHEHLSTVMALQQKGLRPQKCCHQGLARIGAVPRRSEWMEGCKRHGAVGDMQPCAWQWREQPWRHARFPGMLSRTSLAATKLRGHRRSGAVMRGLEVALWKWVATVLPLEHLVGCWHCSMKNGAPSSRGKGLVQMRFPCSSNGRTAPLLRFGEAAEETHSFARTRRACVA
jgi:hypothetical protein